MGTVPFSVLDVLETVNLSASPTDTSELGTPPAVYHLVPGSNIPGGPTYALCTSINWEVKTTTIDGENPDGRARLGFDYALTDEKLMLDFSQPPPDIVQSNLRVITDDIDFQLTVTANYDQILEGNEKVEVRAYIPDLLPTGNATRTAFQTFNITEDYRDARTEKDEKSGCSCTCTTCSDSNQLSLDLASGSGSITTANGFVGIKTDGQNGQKPIVQVGIKLPPGMAVPTQVNVRLQVIEEMKDTQGALVGLGRQRTTNSIASPVVNLVVPPTAVAGTTLWFSMQADLTSQVSSWTRPSIVAGSNGVTEKIIPLELLTNAVFAVGTPTSQKFSGWVGRTSHAMRDESASSLAPGLGQNTSTPGLDRMLWNQTILVPDPAGSGGKVKREFGALLYRANGGTSWFKDGTQPSPDSQDTIFGDTLTDRYGNQAKFNSFGDLMERTDPTGNKTTFQYNSLSGALTKITDWRGQFTNFTPFTATVINPFNTSMSRTVYGLTIQTVNSNGNNRNSVLRWKPVFSSSAAPTNFTLNVLYDDPDGTGPRLAREDNYNYTAGLLTSMTVGQVGGGVFPQTTVLSHVSPTTGDGRLFSWTVNSIETTTIELSRQRNSVIYAGYMGGTIPITDPKSFSIATPGIALNALPNYAVVSHSRGNADPQRTIYQLDHRGRSLRTWDPEQVYLMGLHLSPVNAAMFQTLQSNLNRSFEYQLKPTQRDLYGRIVDVDYGEVLTSITPDPDFLALTNGPRTRQTITATYVNNNPVTMQQPIQNQEVFSWNDTFDKLTDYTDETGNITHQIVNPTNALVTQQRWGDRPLWQNPASTLDADHDGGVSPLDVLVIVNYINSIPGGSGAPVPPGPPAQPFGYFLDVDGDFYIGPLDVQAVTSWLNATIFTQPPVIYAQRQSDFTYAPYAGLPKGLVETETISTARAEGNHVITYTYVNNPADGARHGKLDSMYESTPAGGVATTVYTSDDRGNRNSIKDPADRVTKFWFDNRDRLIAKMDPDPDGPLPLLSVLTRYDYDVFDNIIATQLVNSRLEGDAFIRHYADHQL